jgi:DNA polymerase elongation subunit (family B)
MNPLLFGHNPDERIVAVQHMDERTMRLYFRGQGSNGASTVRFQDERFYPFFYLSDVRLIEGFPKNHWLKQLEGTLFYRYLCAFEEWPVLWDAIRYVMEKYNRSALTKVANYTDLDVLYVVTDPAAQYLMQSGRTLFKGMTIEDLHRLQVDIETYTQAPHRFSNASRKSDRIILIALSDNRGWQHLIDGKKLSEEEMLRELVLQITEKDPDVIEGHNIFNFDLPYILARCALHGIVPALGRGGGTPRVFDSRTAFAEHLFEYTVTDIPGRQIIDTLLLVQSYDASRRTMESYGLKYAARFFGLASPDRTYVKPERISWHWDHDVHPLMQYAMDDVLETRALAAHLSSPSFYLTQIVPGNYGAVSRMGSAAKIEHLMIREYLRKRHSLPKPLEGVQTSGGYTDVFVVGTLGPVVHADVESLYPSIMVTERIHPGSDALSVFPDLLRELTAMRLDAKRRMRAETDPVEKSRLDAMQSSFKILINSFYGYLGYVRALFNDFARADAVTQTGQRLLRQMMAFIRSEGGKVIEVDTDGLFFVPPEGVKTEDGEREFVDSLSRIMPEGITVAMDGRYRKMLSYKKKNYALLSYDERVRIKGSALVSRSMEQFGRMFLQQCIEHLLQGNIDGLHRQYVDLHHAITEHKLEAKDFARTESLKDSLEEYKAQVGAGKWNRSAAYEVAIATARQIRPGDRISYYISGNDPNVRSFENCKSIDEWDPNFPDENVPFYLKKLDEFSEKFVEFFRPTDFRAIFSAEDLFPFSSSGMLILTTDVQTEEATPEEDRRAPMPGIWLDEEN